MRVAVDAMGGDFAPEEIVLGAIQALREYSDKKIEITLVGDTEQINHFLKKHNGMSLGISVHHASEIIEMSDHPAAAVRKKKDSSLVVSTRLVKEGVCEAVVSAGNTGAAAAAALLILGRISNIERPSILTPIPNLTGVTALLDSGAHVDGKPKHLVQGAIMGSIYAEYVLNIPNPRIGLLNIGEEDSKGNEQVLETLPLLRKMHTVNFIGNVEGRDITKGTVDVVVCDGFVGNIVLKTGEGLAEAIIQLLKQAINESGIMTKIAAFLLLPALKNMMKRLDYAEYGGAPLLGVNGGYIICHGSSKAKAIKNAIRVAYEFNEKKVVEHIRNSIAKEETAVMENNELTRSAKF